MNDAEELFNQLILRFFEQSAVIGSFRQVFLRGLPMARRGAARDHAELVNQLLTDPEYEGILDRQKIREAGADWLPELIRRMTETAVSSAETSVNAASLVFAHSVLDAATFDLCRVTAMRAPHDWEPSVKDRQVPLLSIAESRYEELLRRALDRFLEQLEKESLLKKAGSAV